MQRFAVRKIYALNSKGKVIPAGTIRPVRQEYRLDSPESESKMHLFAIARQGKSLEQAKTLQLEVEPERAIRPQTVGVEVLYAHTFELENLADGDYWDEVPQSLRFEVQTRLADELMDLADPEPPGLFSMPPRRRYPYQGVAFAVSGLDQLAALFPPE